MPVSIESPSVVHLMEAQKPQLDLLQEQVKKTNGVAQVLVHPYYKREGNGLFRGYESSSDYNTKRDKFISSLMKHGLPTLILEECHRVEQDLPLNLPKHEGNVFVMPTYANSSDIAKPYTWNEVAKRLKDANVQRAVLSGQVLGFMKPTAENADMEIDFPGEGVRVQDASKLLASYVAKMAQERGISVEELAAYRLVKENVIPTGCLGVASIAFLQNHIDVTFSAVSASGWPTSIDAQKILPSQWFSRLN